MNQEIYNKLAKVLEAQLGVDLEQVTPDSNLIKDLGADSLDSVDIVMAIEEEFDIDIPEQDVERMEQDGTVRGLVDYIEAHAD